jgi:chromosome partitioning protein
MDSGIPIFFNPDHCLNESEVESKFIVHYLLPALGYTPQNWRQEVTFGSIRLDFLAVAANLVGHQNQLQLVIEAKHPRQNLDLHVRKLSRYLKSVNVRHGLLTNGRLLRVYEYVDNSIKLLLEVPGQAIPENLDNIKTLIGREALQSKTGNLDETAVISASKVSLATNIAQSNPNPHLEAKMKVIAIYHNKGGVGKTTTVVNLAAALSKLGKRILVIDLDSQANTTFATGLVKFQDELNDTIKNCYVYHVIKEKNKYSISEVVRKSSFTSPEFDVIPSHIDLMANEPELLQMQPAFTRLVGKLKKVEEDYDIVLIDTPPSLNLYARIALIASDYFIIPSDLKPFANEGLKNVQNFIDDINEFREQIGKIALKPLGVLPSKIATTPRFVEYTLPKMESIVKERYGFSLMKSRIFERRDVSAAIERTVDVGDLEIPDPSSILDYKPDSQGAEEFEKLANEVLGLINT